MNYKNISKCENEVLTKITSYLNGSTDYDRSKFGYVLFSSNKSKLFNTINVMQYLNDNYSFIISYYHDYVSIDINNDNFIIRFSDVYNYFNGSDEYKFQQSLILSSEILFAFYLIMHIDTILPTSYGLYIG